MNGLRFLAKIEPRLIALLMFLAVLPITVSAYDGSTHQTLTFLAARQFNRCVEDSAIAPLTPLQVRYMARSNVAVANANLFAKMFRWRYYDRSAQQERSLLWLIDTRFHEQFNEQLSRLRDADTEVDAYRQLGRLANYLQIVTSPAHVVPVFAARFWRLSFSDRFDSYPVDTDLLTDAISADCGFLSEMPTEYLAILNATAADTLAAVRAPITGMPVTWQAFWTFARDDDSFGEYGPAGNSFGRKTEFRCGEQERCLLLRDDPLYRDFALARHLEALRATMAAMYLHQLERTNTPAASMPR